MFFKSLPTDAGLKELGKATPRFGAMLQQFRQTEFSIPATTVELLCAYVSSLNACQFCTGVHRAASEAMGVPPRVMDSLADLDNAPIQPKLKTLLQYARKITQTPSRVTQADVDAALAHWNEGQLRDALFIASFVNLINRMVSGAGIEKSAEELAIMGRQVGVNRSGLAQ
jgi:AhpD family alkylhydroperoxidase